MTEIRFSLTPRLIAVGLLSLLAVFVLLFLLGLQVGQRSRPPAKSAMDTAATNAIESVQKQAADAEAAARKKLELPAVAAPAAPAPAPAVIPVKQ